MSWITFEAQGKEPRATSIIQSEVKTTNSKSLSAPAFGLKGSRKMPALQKATAVPSSTSTGHLVTSSQARLIELPGSTDRGLRSPVCELGGLEAR
jgi:hypothetical protein